MSNTMHQPNYSNDLFSKYTLSREDEGSACARNIIIECVTGIRVREGTVLSPSLDPDTIGKERIILGVHVRGEQDRHFNVEMQTTCRGIAETIRFEFYGVRTLNNRLKSGELYDRLKPVYQIIFTDGYAWSSRNLINHCQIRSEQREGEDGYPPILRIFVHMPAIDGIVKERKMQRLNDSEQLVYLLENNGKNDVLKSEEGLVRVFMNKYEGMQKDDELWSTAMAIQMGEAHYRNGLHGSFKEGKVARKVEGKIEGRLEGERQLLHKLMKIKYHEDCAM